MLPFFVCTRDTPANLNKPHSDAMRQHFGEQFSRFTDYLFVLLHQVWVGASSSRSARREARCESIIQRGVPEYVNMHICTKCVCVPVPHDTRNKIYDLCKYETLAECSCPTCTGGHQQQQKNRVYRMHTHLNKLKRTSLRMHHHFF